MRFFAAIRMMLSRISGADLLNAMAHDIIKKHILPPLEEEAEGEGVDAMSAAELVEMYTEYTGNSARAKIFGAQAFKAIRMVAARYNMDETGIDELVSKLAQDMYKRQSWKLFKTVEKGPEAFAKWFTGVARMDAMSNARDISYHTLHEKHLVPLEDDGSDPIENLPDDKKDPMELMVQDETQRDIRQLIKRKFGNKKAHLELFDAWLDAFDRHGKPNIHKDVLPAVSERLGIPIPTLYGYLQEMLKALRKFFRDEYGMRPIRACEGMTVVDRVAYQEFRRRIAAWVLPQHPILRMLFER